MNFTAYAQMSATKRYIRRVLNDSEVNTIEDL